MWTRSSRPYDAPAAAPSRKPELAHSAWRRAVIPPNAGPPKHLVFHDPRVEEKLRQQLVYQACVSRKDMAAQKFFAGNRLVIKYRDEVIGEGQIILVSEGAYEDLTPYDAVVMGYEKTEDLVAQLKREVPPEKKAEATEFYKILYRWL